MNARFEIVQTEDDNLWHLVRVNEDGTEEDVDKGELSWIEWLRAFCIAARVAG